MVFIPAGDVVCVTETEPLGLVRPDCGRTIGRDIVPPPFPDGACAHSMDVAAGISMTKHTAGIRLGLSTLTRLIIYMHGCI